MKLNRIKDVRASARDEAEYRLLQQLFWTVYALEKPIAMRMGRSSVKQSAPRAFWPLLTSRDHR